jgi:hypothetical protein
LSFRLRLQVRHMGTASNQVWRERAQVSHYARVPEHASFGLPE